MRVPAPSLVKLAMVILLPFVATGVQALFWSQVQPHVWYFFLPAVLLGGRLSGRVGAVMATALSVALMAYFFLDPVHSFRVDDTRQVLSTALFASVGLLFASLLPRHPAGSARPDAAHPPLNHDAGRSARSLENINAS